MDENRKRVLGIIAGILVAPHLEKFRRHQQHAAKSSVGISCSIRGSVGGEDYAED